MARPANANAAQTRQRIIDAASYLFADKGRGATSVREIADRAQVNSAMISHYFGGKDALYDDCIKCLYKELEVGQSVLESALVLGIKLPDVIAGTMKNAIVFARKNRSMIRLVMRHVLDRGQLDPGRRDSVLMPFLDRASAALRPHSSLDEQQLKMGLQSLIFLTVRYGLSSDEELQALSGVDDFTTAIGQHLGAASMSLLGLKEAH